MDDFIRPPKKEIKKETKQRPIKEILIVILIIVCLAIGYFAGYVSKKDVVVKSTNNKVSLTKYTKHLINIGSIQQIKILTWMPLLLKEWLQVLMILIQVT